MDAGPPLPVQYESNAWLRWVITAMGVCTPGGLLFLLALVGNTNIHFDNALWYLLAAGGGGVGYWIGGRALRR